MTDYDGQFWVAFYRWSIMTPVERMARRLALAVDEVAWTIGTAFTGPVRSATWAMEDFAFEWSLHELSPWQRRRARIMRRLTTLPRRWWQEVVG